jgi:hypothetical protein
MVKTTNSSKIVHNTLNDNVVIIKSIRFMI